MALQNKYVKKNVQVFFIILNFFLLSIFFLTEVRPPSPKGTPVTVEFSIFVVDINSINVEDMDFRVDMFVHQKWVEDRLVLHDEIFEEGDDYVTLPPEFFDNLWQPDPYFLNSKIAGKEKYDDFYQQI